MSNQEKNETCYEGKHSIEAKCGDKDAILHQLDELISQAQNCVHELESIKTKVSNCKCKFCIKND